MSFDVLSDLNWLAVIVAGVASFALGALWYAPPVFGRAWLTARGGRVPEDGSRPGPGVYLAPLVGSLLSAIAIGMLAQASGTDTADEGFVLGLVVGIGFGLAISLVIATFESDKPKPFVWGAINAGYQIFGAVLAGVIIGAWQ
jgi:hypothetical protein